LTSDPPYEPYRPSDDLAWPPAGDAGKDSEARALYDAKLGVRQKRTDEQIARGKAELDAQLADARARADATIETRKAYYAAIFEVAKGAIDRARASAETVQKSSTAIAGLYTGALTLVFSVEDHPLPTRGLIPLLFLGAAVVCSTAYLAYFPSASPQPSSADQEDNPDISTEAILANRYINWTRQAALARSYPVRMSVIALAFGLAFLPSPFINWHGERSSASAQSLDERKPAWPSAALENGANVELAKILFAAQVKEYADARQTPAVSQEDETMWWVLALIGAAIVVIGPAVSRWSWSLAAEWRPRVGSDDRWWALVSVAALLGLLMLIVRVSR